MPSSATKVDSSIMLMVNYLRNRSGVDQLTLQRWFSLAAELKKHGILGSCAQSIIETAPAPLAREVLTWYASHKHRMQDRLNAICEFSAAAKANHLHAILIKGMGLSYVAYRNPLARQSGDLDILVDADDVPKADWILRSLGWLQPGEARLLRMAHSSNALTNEMLEKLVAPYPLRSNVILPHVTNYYRECGDCFETIEVHDRFHGLDHEMASSLLWESDLVNLPVTEMLTPGLTAAFIVSCLSLHEDSETVRSNTTERGSMGLKACVDIHALLGQMTDRQLDESLRWAMALNVQEKVAAALRNAVDVFPEDGRKAESFFAYAPKFTWSLHYLDRAFCPELRARQGVIDLGMALKSAAVPSALSSSWNALNVVSRRLPSIFLARIAQKKGGSSIEWMIPKELSNKLEELVFQVVVLSAGSEDALGYRINAFVEKDAWSGVVQRIDVNTVDGHANKITSGRPACVRATYEDDGIVVSVDSPCCPMAAFASIWLCVYGQLHRRIAGIDFADIADGAVGQ